jgi:hypothetical protein
VSDPGVTAPGGAWWGERWLALLDEAGPADARRVQRGQAIGRRGGVEDLVVHEGRITGRVAEDRVRPYVVELRCPVPDDDAWARAVTALAGEVRSTAALLDGRLPEEVADVLAAAGVPLIPDVDALERRCTCTERASWCRHVAAVHTAAGLAFARDPSLLLSLRGRERDHLLRELRAERGERPEPGAELDLSRGMFEARGDLDAVVLAPHPVDDPAALLLHLGEPPGVDDAWPLVRLIERAADTAWHLAAGEGEEVADEALLLAELRAQRVATAGSLATALGRDADEVGTQLDELFAAGTVLRTGSGERTRYRAP